MIRKIEIFLILCFAAIVQIPSQAQTICNGDSVTLALNGYLVGGIQWQSSPDSITWSNISGATTDSFNVISSQTTYYRAVVTEGTCLPYYSETVQITINNITVSAGANLIICAGESVVIGGSPTASGGAAPYFYSWDPAVGLSDSTVANPTASPVSTATYTVTITDTNGCTAIDNVTITVYPLPTADFSATTVCSGTPTQFTDLSSSFVIWSWDFGDADTSSLPNPAHTYASPGTYSVTLTVTDANGCTQTGNVNISAAPPAISLSFFTSDVSVCNICDGFAAVTPSGGIAPYTYLWSDGQTTANATGLCIGSYSVTVTDSLGCTVIGNINILPPYTFGLSFSQTAADFCGECVGSGIVSVGGGSATPPYTYLWSNGQTNSNATGLCYSQIYTVTVIDANGCIKSGNLSPIGGGPGISLSFFSTDASCGICDGFAAVTPSGGSGFTYLWSNGQTTPSVTGLCV
ncbi:MAG: PKD domain-containing protein, partial [Bacteroidetes bacterium]|nr:PKD domain-containing protein [Bacteroidota bacterium]